VAYALHIEKTTQVSVCAVNNTCTEQLFCYRALQDFICTHAHLIKVSHKSQNSMF